MNFHFIWHHSVPRILLFLFVLIISTYQTMAQTCQPTSDKGISEFIGRVQFPDIDLKSGRTATGYESYSLVEAVGTVGLGTEVEISITPKWLGTQFDEGYSVWIDYNFDGDFDDPNENVLTIAPTQSSIVSASFTILESLPDGILSGITSMRVAMNRGVIPTSCDSFGYGEVEDYYVSLVNYCKVGISWSSDEEYISRVQIGSIDNSSGAGVHQIFKNISSDLTPGEQTDITITPAWLSTIYNEAYSVYIDYNKDLDFEDDGELVLSVDPTQSTTVNGNFVVENYSGPTRMRILMNRDSPPEICEFFLVGEAEDYVVNIQSINDFLDFNLPEQISGAKIDSYQKTVHLEVAFGTDLTNLTSTFTLSDGATAKINEASQSSGSTVNDFTDPVTYTITAADGTTTDDWIVNVSVQEVYSETDFLAFSFPEQAGNAIISTIDHTVDIEVKNGTSLNELVSYFSVSPGGIAQIGAVDQLSETTINDFTNPVTYTIIAEDGLTSQDWIVTVTVKPLSTETDFLSFAFQEQTGEAIIDNNSHEIDIEVSFGTNLSSLVSEFELSEGAIAMVSSIEQISGISANDFTGPVIYLVTAEDGNTTQEWTVNVAEEVLSTETNILSFGLAQQSGPPTINLTNHTVTVEVPFGTNVTALVAEFSLSEGASAKVNTVDQVSGTNANDFTNPVVYLITAEDGITTREWTVTVIIEPNSENDIISFTFQNQITDATINSSNHSVYTEASNGTDLSSLIVEFTLSAGAIAQVNSIDQISGTTANDFTSQVVYTVIAEDGSSQDWIINMEEDLAPSITSFSPTNGPVGTVVNISGINFDPVPTNNVVFVGTTQADILSATSTNLEISIPEGANFEPIAVLASGRIGYSNIPFNITFAGSMIDGESFEEKVDFITEANPNSIIIGDFDGDGKPDLATSNIGSNSISLFRNTTIASEPVSFAAMVSYPSSGGIRALTTEDLDGDGKLDLGSAHSGSQSVNLFRNISPESGIIDFAPKVHYNNLYAYAIAMSDFDSDGRSDVAITSYDPIRNKLTIYRNNSSVGNFSFPSQESFVTEIEPSSVAAGDFDNDGYTDLVLANKGSNKVSVYRNTSMNPGILSFGDKLDYSTWSDPNYVTVGDLDGDQKLDLIVSNESDNSIAIYKNSSSGIGNINFEQAIKFNVGALPTSIAVGDLNGDGRLDLAVANWNSNSVSVLMNLSTNEIINFNEKVDLLTGTNPVSVTIGDLNADGRADIGVANRNENTVSIFINKILPANTETDILSFSITGQTSAAIINATNHTIYLEMSYGTDIADLVADFSLSEGAVATVNSIVQVSGSTSNDFTNPVIYTITAEDGITIQDWLVTLTVPPNTETDIVQFSFTSETEPALIDLVEHTVDIEVDFSANLSALAPNISVSAGATISPESGTLQDFTLPVTYTVTADDGITVQDWTVNVSQAILNIEDELSGIGIYPNPVEDLLKIEVTDHSVHISAIAILDISGQVIEHIDIGDMSNINFDLKNYPSGIYLLRIVEKHNMHMLKILKE